MCERASARARAKVVSFEKIDQYITDLKGSSILLHLTLVEQCLQVDSSRSPLPLPVKSIAIVTYML